MKTRETVKAAYNARNNIVYMAERIKKWQKVVHFLEVLEKTLYMDEEVVKWIILTFDAPKLTPSNIFRVTLSV